jgi:phage terminase small subunit
MAKKLTDKQKMFVKEYLIDLNATQAAIRAGYSAKETVAKQQGSENLAKPYIQEAIQEAMAERAEKVGIKAEDVLTGIKKLTELVSNPVNEEFNATAGLKGYELQGKHLKLFTDKMEHSGDKDNPINHKWEVEIVSPKDKDA